MQYAAIGKRVFYLGTLPIKTTVLYEVGLTLTITRRLLSVYVVFRNVSGCFQGFKGGTRAM